MMLHLRRGSLGGAIGDLRVQVVDGERFQLFMGTRKPV